MKIKLDENVTTGVIPVLRKLGYDVHTTSEKDSRASPTVKYGLRHNPINDFWSHKIWIFLTPGNSRWARITAFCFCVFIRQIKQRLFRASLSFFRTKIQNRGEIASLWRLHTRYECSAGDPNI
jgi:hypothetical protein